MPAERGPRRARDRRAGGRSESEKVYRKMRGWAARSTTQSPGEDYHEIRKKGKELRYLLELFGQPGCSGPTTR